MSYMSTAVQVLAAGTQFHNLFLQGNPVSQESIITLVESQGDASFFNVPNTVYGLTDPFSLVGGPDGDRIASVDLVSERVPVLFSTSDRINDTPFFSALGCNTFKNTDNSGKNRARCYIKDDSAPYQYGTGWAICNGIDSYARNALWMYDADVFNATTIANEGCTPIDLLVVAAPA